MKIKRYIDAKENNVRLEYDRFQIEWDLAHLRDQNIALICDDGIDIWVEREPFNGREHDFDFSIAYEIFDGAWLKAQEQLKKETEVRNTTRHCISVIQLMKAIDEVNLQDKYLEWAESKERSFLEKAMIRYQTHYFRNDPLLLAMGKALGLNDREYQHLFELAKSYPE